MYARKLATDKGASIFVQLDGEIAQRVSSGSSFLMCEGRSSVTRVCRKNRRCVCNLGSLTPSNCATSGSLLLPCSRITPAGA